MSYIKDRIAKNRETDLVYRAAYDEEVNALAREEASLREIMGRAATLRRAKRITRREIAVSLQTSPERIGRLEKGAETPSVGDLLRFLEAVGVRLALVPDEDVRRLGLESATVTHAFRG